MGFVVYGPESGVTRAMADAFERADLEAMHAEANAFAMELLMPEAWLRKDAAVMDICDDKAVERLAKKYRVSASVMAYRLGELGSDASPSSGDE